MTAELPISHHMAMDARVLNWAKEASNILGDGFDFILPLLQSTERDLADVLVRQLSVVAHTSSESVLVLAIADRPWGAEMIVRSVAEGTVKAVVLDIAPEAERLKLAEDFWYAGLALAHLKDDEKLRAFLKHVPDPSADRWQFFRERLFTEEEKADVDNVYPPSMRSEHGRHWSFRVLCEKLAGSGRATFQDLAHSAYLYSISSHILHCDAFAVAVAADRVQRTEAEREALGTAHSARLISDVLSFAVARISAAAGRRAAVSSVTGRWADRVTTILSEMEVAHEACRSTVSGHS